MNWRFALILFVVTRGFSCVCTGPAMGVREAWRTTAAVFLGTVEIADPDGDPRQTMFGTQFVRIRVNEAFKGVSIGQTVSLNQGGTDCDAKFRTGERAVFYLQAGTAPGTWRIPWCSYAIGSAEPLGDDLVFLRGLPGSLSGSRLSGTIALYENSPQEGFKKVKGIANLRVKISGPRGLMRDAVTNAAGLYETYGLPPGKYTVRIDPPKDTRMPAAPGDPLPVNLDRDGEASMNFVLEADTKTSGRMLDAQGTPKQDVCIDLEPLRGRGENGARFFNCSKKQTGDFQMEMMPPGEYWLVAHDEVNVEGLKSTSTLYYPGVRDRAGAKSVKIEAGKYISDIEIRIPEAELRHKVSGRFVFSDGQPVVGAGVSFVSEAHGYTESASTADDGTFAFYIVAGMEGQLNGQTFIMDPVLKSCPDFQPDPVKRGMLRFLRADSVLVASDSDHNDLVLKFPFASCKSWKGYPSRKLQDRTNK